MNMKTLSSKNIRKNLFYSSIVVSLLILFSFQNCGKVNFSAPKTVKAISQSCGSIVMTPSSGLYLTTNINFKVVVPSGITISSIKWDFTRAATSVFTSTTNPVTHTFDGANEGSGDYVATASFAKDDGNSCELSSSFHILSGDSCVDPSGISGPAIGYVGEETSGFTINFEDCFKGSVVWDMNSDGTPEYNVPNAAIRTPVTYIYSTPGIYTVKATVTNSSDQTKTILTHTINIQFKKCINPFTNQVVPHGQAVQFAKRNVTCGNKPCSVINKTCNNGVFVGDSTYTQNPANCPVSAACPVYTGVWKANPPPACTTACGQAASVKTGTVTCSNTNCNPATKPPPLTRTCAATPACHVFSISTCGFSLTSGTWSAQPGQPTQGYNSCEWAGWMHPGSSTNATAIFDFGDYFDGKIVRLTDPSNWTITAVGCTLNTIHDPNNNRKSMPNYCASNVGKTYDGHTPLVWKATITVKNNTTGQVTVLPITATFKPTLQ
jgi:PKD repeat protein